MILLLLLFLCCGFVVLVLVDVLVDVLVAVVVVVFVIVVIVVVFVMVVVDHRNLPLVKIWSMTALILPILSLCGWWWCAKSFSCLSLGVVEVGL